MNAIKYFNVLKERIQEIQKINELDESIMWERHEVIIWKADSFKGKPNFYPVYQWNNYYSFSVLALIVLKQNLNFNKNAYELSRKNPLHIFDKNNTIDKDIKRICFQSDIKFQITDPKAYAEKIKIALINDISRIENKNPGKTNLIMCGGKDSLNLLLLPWRNPVIALSADPNYPLVKQFIKDNQLDIPIIKLDDKYNKEFTECEILEACCRADITHWRWGFHLYKIVKKFNNNCIIWKGQLGDVFLGNTWKSYIYPEKQPVLFLSKVYKKISNYLPGFINHLIGRKFQTIAIETTFNKSSTLQGCHMGFIRALTNCLVLSAYHGLEVQKIVHETDFSRAVQNDIRPAIGELLLGKTVIYPEKNPAPDTSNKRIKLNGIEKYYSVYKSLNINK